MTDVTSGDVWRAISGILSKHGCLQWACNIGLDRDLHDAMNALLAPTPPEPPDEWRKALEEEFLRSGCRSKEARSNATVALSAIDPLREKLEKDARSWKFVAECEKKANATDRQRAEAAEAKLAKYEKTLEYLRD